MKIINKLTKFYLLMDIKYYLKKLRKDYFSVYPSISN